MIKCVGCNKDHERKLMSYPGCSNKCGENNPRVFNKKLNKGVEYPKSYKDYPAIKRVNVFMDLQVGFEDYITDNNIPNKPGSFYGPAIQRKGNTYFEFGDHYKSMVVDGLVKTNIVYHSYTLLGQAHRTLDDYKKMVIDTFNKGNKKEVIYD